jgi:hypothetical protein
MVNAFNTVRRLPLLFASVAPLPFNVIDPLPKAVALPICTVPAVIVVPPLKSLAEVNASTPAPDFAKLVVPEILSVAVAPVKVYVPDAADTVTEPGVKVPLKVIVPPAVLLKVALSPLA